MHEIKANFEAIRQQKSDDGLNQGSTNTPDSSRRKSIAPISPSVQFKQRASVLENFLRSATSMPLDHGTTDRQKDDHGKLNRTTAVRQHSVESGGSSMSSLQSTVANNLGTMTTSVHAGHELSARISQANRQLSSPMSVSPMTRSMYEQGANFQEKQGMTSVCNCV